MQPDQINRVLNFLGTVIIIFGIVLYLLILFFFTARAAHAANITLAWDANAPAPEGYLVFMRVDGQSYDYSKPSCKTDQTTCTIIGLVPATTYFFVARAYVAEDQSGDSNEVDYKPPLAAPINLRLVMEISLQIDVNGKPIILSQSNMKAE